MSSNCGSLAGIQAIQAGDRLPRSARQADPRKDDYSVTDIEPQDQATEAAGLDRAGRQGRRTIRVLAADAVQQVGDGHHPERR